LPFAASAFSSVIAEKFLVSELIEIAGTFTVAPEPPELAPGELLPQAERARPVARAIDATMLFLVTRLK
jgi:hypothetical protein